MIGRVAQWLAGAAGGAAMGFFTMAGLSVFMLGGPNYGSWSWKSFATGALMAVLAILFFAAVATPSYSAELKCSGAGKCVCTETPAAKSIIGYEAESVSVTCINMQTMSVEYYTIPHGAARGQYNGTGEPQ